jgi:hypothetical protein
MVSKVTMAVTRPVWTTLAHMRPSIRRSSGRRGCRDIRSSAKGSTPMARAGPESVIRLIQSSCVASRGRITVPPGPASPITPAPTTPRNTVSTSPMLDDSR